MCVCVECSTVVHSHVLHLFSFSNLNGLATVFGCYLMIHQDIFSFRAGMKIGLLLVWLYIVQELHYSFGLGVLPKCR